MSEHTPLPWHAKMEHISDRGDWTPAQIWGAWESPEPKIVSELAARPAMNANARLIVQAVNSHASMIEALKAFVEAWEKSHQLEKTDVALRMARKALMDAGEQA